MPGKVIAMDVRLAAAVLGAVRTGEVAAFCRQHQISRQTFYKYRRRAAAEGRVGLESRSRRPRRSPTRTSTTVEERIVRLRKELAEAGFDHGPWSIQQRLVRDSTVVPSEATIWRILVRRGLIVPEPRKRPKVSLRRFQFPRPNDCWQIDATHWHLTRERAVEIINIEDDHSRLVVASVAVSTCTGVAAWDAFVGAGSVWGIPAMVLSDNGMAFNGSRRGFTVEFEANLRAAGVRPIVSTPRHPQTCGKVERFHLTMKRWLTQQPPAGTLGQLQAQLDQFLAYYNHQRPHRALHGAIPHGVWQRTVRAVPLDHPITDVVTVERHITVSATGQVRIDHAHQIHIGIEYAGIDVDVITTGLDCVIFWGNQLVRNLQIDPTRYHQPSGRPPGGPRRARLKDS
jgi:transposase InsO family protein